MSHRTANAVETGEDEPAPLADPVDAASMQSFPASDPHPWWVGVQVDPGKEENSRSSER